MSKDLFDGNDVVAVLTTQPLGKILDYKAPEGGCLLGAFVEVPLGPRKVIGVVWQAGRAQLERAKLRRVIRVLDAPPMREEMQEFLQKAGAYTVTPLSAMLKLATRSPGLSDPPMMRKIYRLGVQPPDRQTAARAKVLALLEEFPEAVFTMKELAQQAGVSASVIKGLVAQGALVEEDSPRDLPYQRLDPTRPGKTLSNDQQQAVAQLGANGARYSTTLLKGVTGSGKTEVYLEAVAACLREGRQALVLLPEIALTSEFLIRVEARFGARPAEWHSGVTMTQRRRLWRMVSEGGAQLVVGARSALFLPFRDLGLIVVDEEHDSSYKQEEGVFYNARDMAVLRGSICSAKVILASATPSLESWANAVAGKYQRVELASRFGEAVLPEVRTIDLRRDELPSGRWVSSTLQREIEARLARQEQSLVFLNRRGYAPLTLCRACGHQICCDHCDARLVEHRFLDRLICHQCGESQSVPSQCPSCGAQDRLAPVGPGVERMGEELSALFPQARVVVLSSDLYATARELKAHIEAIAQGEADIIIGTQLVAKGHNFPLLTLVGVIDADLGLQGSDLRAAEHTFQLMRQVAGRAGRSDKPGLALMQTYQPEHPVIRAIVSGQEEAFWQAEAREREQAGMPPYGRLAGVILSGPNLEAVFELGAYLARHDAPLRQVGAVVYGPAPAPVSRIRGRHRVRLLVKAAKGAALQSALRSWTRNLRLKDDLRLQIDIDPQSFF